MRALPAAEEERARRLRAEAFVFAAPTDFIAGVFAQVLGGRV